MRIFITGPLGYIGRPVAAAFRAAGHQVRGLVRSEEKARILMHEEIEPIVGDLAHPDTYAHAIEQAEVVVHCGMDTAPSGLDTESRVVRTLLSNQFLRSTQTKAVIYTSGVWVIGNTGDYFADESSPLNPLSLVKWRRDIEERILEASSTQFRTLVMRPGCVYGTAGGLTSLWFSSTLRGTVEIVGDGNNHWSMVHQEDLAQAYVLAAEKELNGQVFNIVDNTHATVNEMATAVSFAAGIGGRVESLSLEDAEQKYEGLTEGLTVDQHISNERAQRLLGWYPKHRSFIDGVSDYYMAWKTAQLKS